MKNTTIELDNIELRNALESIDITKRYVAFTQCLESLGIYGAMTRTEYVIRKYIPEQSARFSAEYEELCEAAHGEFTLEILVGGKQPCQKL